MDTASKLNNTTHFLYLPDASWRINTSVKKNIR